MNLSMKPHAVSDYAIKINIINSLRFAMFGGLAERLLNIWLYLVEFPRKCHSTLFIIDTTIFISIKRNRPRSFVTYSYRGIQPLLN